MLLPIILLQNCETGEKTVYDRRDKFMASFKGGQWAEDLLFADAELSVFVLSQDDAEIEKAAGEARLALGRPLVIPAESSDSSVNSAESTP